MLSQGLHRLLRLKQISRTEKRDLETSTSDRLKYTNTFIQHLT